MPEKLPSITQAEQSQSQLQIIKQLLSLSDKTDEVSNLLKQVDEIERMTKEVLAIPETFTDFNNSFNSLGWHAHSSLPITLLEQANKLAQDGHIEDAEILLTDYYIDKFDYHFILLRGLPTYFEREHIFEKAKERFFQEDYISCIPLILMMIDGIGYNTFNGVTFKSNNDFNTWDCISTINGDIEKYIKKITCVRRKFTQEQITIPFRNGILHGLDVGYNNKLVAIKTWALLFTIRDILMDKKNEKQKKSKYDEQQDTELNNFLSYLEDPIGYLSNARRELNSLSNWSPSKTPSQWDMVKKTGTPKDFPLDSPEHSVISFLFAWKSSNYGLMAELVCKNNSLTSSQLAGQFRKALSSKKLQDYQIGFIKETRGGIVFGIALTISENNIEWYKDITLITEYHAKKKKTLNTNKLGTWLINDMGIPAVCYLNKP